MASADMAAAGHGGSCASGQHSSWEIKLQLRLGEEKPEELCFPGHSDMASVSNHAEKSQVDCGCSSCESQACGLHACQSPTLRKVSILATPQLLGSLGA